MMMMMRPSIASSNGQLDFAVQLVYIPSPQEAFILYPTLSTS